MALGFQDCCNLSSYFYLNGIPATVSQNEFYHIMTLEGPAFCATYTTIPALNYQPPTYTLDEMTEYTSCDTCFASVSLTCPSADTIFLSQFGPGSISVGTDCSIKTIFPMIVECFSTNPTFDGFADGVVSVFVAGGTPPYSFLNPVNGTAYGLALPVTDNTYTLINGALEGEYPIQVVDAQSDYNIIVNCILQSPPTILTLAANGTNISIFGVCDGTFVINVANGTPPYQIYVNGTLTTETNFTNQCADVYEITVIDSGVDLDQQTASTTVTITEPNQITYPQRLCLTIQGCGTTFYLTFTRQGDYNYRANYVCDNPEDLGLVQLILRWENGWTTTQETSDGNMAFDVPCPTVLSWIVKFVKSTPLSEQPTGTWQSNIGFFQGQTGSVSSGICAVFGGGGSELTGGDPPPPPAPVPILKQPVIADAPCSGQPGSVILEGQGGAGAPYTYYINGIAQTSPTILLQAGTYSATVSDVNGVSSTSYVFTIGTTPPVNINITLTTSVETDLPSFVEQNYGNPGGTRQSYHPVKTIITVTGPNLVDGSGALVQPPAVWGYFLVTVKKQSAFNDYYYPNVQIPLPPAGSEIPLYEIGDNANGVPAPKSYLGPPVFNNLGGALNGAGPTIGFTSSPLVVQETARPFDLSGNFIPSSESSGCQTNSDNITRTLTQEMQIGSQSEPIDIVRVNTLDDITYFLETFAFFIPIDNKFRPQDSPGCMPAVGVEIDVEFVQVSPNPCVNVIFNGGNPVYVASAKQVGGTPYLPHIYSNGVIINGIAG